MKRNFLLIIVFIILLWGGATGLGVTSIQIGSAKQLDSIKIDSVNKKVDSNNYKSLVNNVKDTISSKENVGELTLFVNGLNTIITTYGIVLCLITLLVAIAGFLSIKTLTNKIDTFEVRLNQEKESNDNKILVIQSTINKQFDLKSAEIDKKILLIEEFEKQIKIIRNLEKQIEFHDKFIEKATYYIFNVLDQNANKTKDKKLKDKLISDKQTLKLYSNKKDERVAALLYFSENGANANIDDIQYVSEKDLEEEIRNFAIRVLGRMEERENSKVPIDDKTE